MDIIWILIIIILIINELTSLKLSSIMFIISAFIAIKMNNNNYSFIYQILEFLLIGILLNILFKPLLITFYNKLKINVKKQ